MRRRDKTTATLVSAAIRIARKGHIKTAAELCHACHVPLRVALRVLLTLRHRTRKHP